MMKIEGWVVWNLVKNCVYKMNSYSDSGSMEHRVTIIPHFKSKEDVDWFINTRFGVCNKKVEPRKATLTVEDGEK